MRRPTLCGLVATCTLWSASALANEPAGVGDYPKASGVLLQTRIGGGFMGSNLSIDGKRYTTSGWGPSISFLPGIEFSPRFAGMLELRWQAQPDTDLFRFGHRGGTTSEWQFSLAPTLMTLLGRGAYMQEAAGLAYSSLSVDADSSLNKSRVGGLLAVAIGCDSFVADPWAAGAVARVGYAHFWNRNSSPSTPRVSEDLLSITLEVALTGY